MYAEVNYTVTALQGTPDFGTNYSGEKGLVLLGASVIPKPACVLAVPG